MGVHDVKLPCSNLLSFKYVLGINRKEIENVYDAHFDGIYRFFLIKLQNKTLAEDLTSETFLILADSIKRHKQINDYKSYLYGIAKNVFTNYLKQKYKEVSVDPFKMDIYAEVEFAEETSNNESKLVALAKRLINKLPEKQKQIAKLRLLDKLSFSQIKNLLKKDDNYVKTTQKRAFASLRKMLALNYKKQ